MRKQAEKHADGWTGLRELAPTLPSAAYLDEENFRRDLERIWYRNWLYVGRDGGLKDVGSYQTFAIGDQSILILRDDEGELRAFHNTCRHRGARLCQGESGKLKARALTCPYHAWTYRLDGRLLRTPNTELNADFDPANYPLYSVKLKNWGGFVFVNLAGEAALDFAASVDPGPETYANWPLSDLVVGHSETHTLKCNWKVFWENYNECYHCPTVHPDLCELVPIYKRGLMGPQDASDWTQHVEEKDPRYRGGVRLDAETWSADGKAQGKRFANLSETERRRGSTFVQCLPSVYLVGHQDYMRTVRMKPLTAETTELTIEWLFDPANLADPNFDKDKIVSFGRQVVQEDGAVCELVQKGMHALPHKEGVLLPPEWAVKAFQDWIKSEWAR